MVYLSELILDPMRRETLRLLGDTYRMHQFVLSALPDAQDGGPGRVLYRVESGRGEARALVQSEKPPVWPGLAGVIRRVRGPREVRLRKPDGSMVFTAGQRLRFRLRANPTVKRDGKRRAWRTPEEQCRWLARKGEIHGFEPAPLPSGEDWFDPFGGKPECRLDVRIVKLDHLTGWKRTEAGETVEIEHFGVDFDGVLRVTDPQRFTEAIEKGVGSGKGFGFGLLSVPLP